MQMQIAYAVYSPQAVQRGINEKKPLPYSEDVQADLITQVLL